MYAQSRFEEFNTVEAQVGVSRFIGDLAPVTSPGQGYVGEQLSADCDK